MWLTNRTRVRAVNLAATASKSSSSLSAGRGSVATTTFAPASARDLVPEDPLGAVLVVGQQDLVASPELDASRHRVEPGRHVRNEAEVVPRRRADVPGDALPHPREPGGKPAGEEQHRLELELAPQLVLPLEDGAWHGTEAAVVEERHLGVEHEQLAELLGARWHGREGASRLGRERKLHVDLHLGDPDLDVDAERAGVLEALVAEDGAGRARRGGRPARRRGLRRRASCA